MIEWGSKFTGSNVNSLFLLVLLRHQVSEKGFGVRRRWYWVHHDWEESLGIRLQTSLHLSSVLYISNYCEYISVLPDITHLFLWNLVFMSFFAIWAFFFTCLALSVTFWPLFTNLALIGTFWHFLATFVCTLIQRLK